MGRNRNGRDGHAGRDQRDDADGRSWDESSAYDAYEARDGDSAEYDTYGSYDGQDGFDDAESRSAEYSARGLAVRGADLAPVLADDDRRAAPTLIPGTGISMGQIFLKRRERPLTMRIAVLTLLAAMIVTGLVSVTPLGAAAQPNVSSFTALSGAVVLGNQPGYFWYTARWNDSTKSLATQFNVQEGGIFQMNGLCPGQELQIGKQYKIPTNSQYGANYESQAATQCGGLNPSGYYGQTIFGSTWYNSYAGKPTEEGICSTAYSLNPDGSVNPMGYKFISPNWNSNWVRGFSFFHDGVDIAAPQGNPIHAAQSGQVIYAGYDGTNGFGWVVVINHCNHVSTLYGHMLNLMPGLKAGDNVNQGDVIGYEGSTGWSTGPHLHMTVMVDNVPVDPTLFYTDIYHLTHYVANT